MSGERAAASIPTAYDGSRPKLRQLVPRDARRILDVGCARGAVGEALKSEHRRLEVVGIEVDDASGADAARVLDEVIVGDAELVLRNLASDANWQRGFDCVIAADVLEHLIHPETAMASLARLISPRGLLIISLPNVRHWSVFYEVFVRGRWPRRSAGIFDATHLRWFTRGDIEELLQEAGFRPARWIPVGGGASWRRLIMWCLERSPLQPLVTRQYIVAAVPTH